MHRSIRSPNAIESLFSTGRRRTDPTDSFTAETSCLTLVWAVMQDIRLPKIPVGYWLKRDGSGPTHNQPVMLVREEVFFAAQPVPSHESQALCSERLEVPARYVPALSDPAERRHQLCACACLLPTGLYTQLGMVSKNHTNPSQQAHKPTYEQ